MYFALHGTQLSHASIALFLCTVPLAGYTLALAPGLWNSYSPSNTRFTITSFVKFYAWVEEQGEPFSIFLASSAFPPKSYNSTVTINFNA